MPKDVLSARGIFLGALQLAPVSLVNAIVHRLRGVDAVVTSAIGDGAGNILREVPEVSGSFYHGHGSCARYYVRVYVFSCFGLFIAGGLLSP